MMSMKTRGNWKLGQCMRALKGWKDRKTGKVGRQCRNRDDAAKCEGCIRFSNYVPE